MTLRVETKNAVYLVDRELHRWKRISESHPHDFDNEWVRGGFTLDSVGRPAYAHFEEFPNGALGRWTSTVLNVSEETE
jgi:hypothetical protein